MNDAPVQPSDVEAAATTIAEDIVRTPTMRSQTLSDITGAEIYLKFENLQFTGSFKDRGAANHLRSIDPTLVERGVIALSAGNHAQGVAYHAARLGLPATIVMPTSAPFSKVTSTRALGATVVQAGETLAETVDEMARLRDEHGLHFIPPYDDRHVIAGQGTVALEMLADAPELEVLVAPVGGGGLLSGMAVAARGLRPDIELVGVQVDSYPQAWAGFHRCDALPSRGPTIADGIAVKGTGKLTLPLIADLVNDMLLVTEASTEQAVTLYAEIEKTVVEGAGAVGLAALLENRERFAGRKVGLVVSGGNIDIRLLTSVLVRGLARTERVSSIRVEVSDLPGGLAPIVDTIAETGASVIDIEHRRTFGSASARTVTVNVVIETRDLEHRSEVLAALEQCGYTASLSS